MAEQVSIAAAIASIAAHEFNGEAGAFEAVQLFDRLR
jgi:hypothetical protein